MPTWKLLPAPPFTRPQLTPQQRRIVADDAAVQVVVGGPGTGKTLLLVESVVERVMNGIPLERLVVLATSRAQAQEIRRQVAHRLPRGEVMARITTVHGLALGIMSAEPDVGFRLMRAPEQELVIRELLDGLGEGFWPIEYRAAARTRTFARQLREFLAQARRLGIDPDEIAPRTGFDPLYEAVGRFAQEYLDVTDLAGSVDYAELLHRTRVLLAQESVATSLRSRFDTVFADDVQDQDASQVGLLTDLAAAGIPLRAYADPHQRTSGFRGATGEVLPRLEALPGTKRLELTQGFRNRGAVSEALTHLRSRMSAVDAPPSPEAADGPPGSVHVFHYDSLSNELGHVAAQIRLARHDEGIPFSEMAIITRAGRAQLAPIAAQLTRLGVPLETSGDELPVAQQHAVQALFAGLRFAAANAPTSPAAAQELLAGPLAGVDAIGQRSLGRALARLRPQEGTATHQMGRVLEEPHLVDGVDSAEAARVVRLAGLLHEARDLARSGARVGEVLWALWDGTAWPRRLQQSALDGSRTAHHELDGVVELFELLSRHEDLAGTSGIHSFIKEVEGEDIVADRGRELEVSGMGVRLVTAHRARLGQWRRVWVVSVQEGSWPRGRRPAPLLDPQRLVGSGMGDDLATHLADERRLFHVACSRARESLVVSAVAAGSGELMPSRFCGELGVAPILVDGGAGSRLTPVAWVGELRRTVEDPGAPEVLRRAAALGLARQTLSPERRHVFRNADPGTWWGLAPPSSSGIDRPDVVTISGTSLHRILTCPRQWFLEQQVKAGGPPSSMASLGTVMHELVQLAEERELDLEEMKQQLRTLWSRISFEAPWRSAAEQEAMERALERFDVWRHAPERGRRVATERRFSVELEVTGRTVRLVGSVDRLELVDGRLRVIDYKTGRHSAKGASGYREQLGVYQLAASLGAFDDVAPGIRAVAAPELVFIRAEKDGHTLVETQPSIDETPFLGNEPLPHGPTWVHDSIARAIRIIDSGNHPAIRSDACRHCAFKDSCPAWRSVGTGES